MRDLEPGEAYVTSQRKRRVYHTWVCPSAVKLRSPDVVAISDLHSSIEYCKQCRRSLPDADRPDGVPKTVSCPCGNGYAERRPEPIVEIVNGTWKQRRVTHTYKHDGCPVGGHIVEQAGRIRVMAGPLFEPDRYSERAIDGAVPEVVADGGEPEDTEGVHL